VPQVVGFVALTAEALSKELECAAHVRRAEEVHPEAEFVVLCESPLG
jgi:hypothetical protein